MLPALSNTAAACLPSCRAANKERIKVEQERLRARFESKRQAAAAAAPAAEAQPTRLPGHWTPEQRGIPAEQPQ
jgi:hypothetical protein